MMLRLPLGSAVIEISPLSLSCDDTCGSFGQKDSRAARMTMWSLTLPQVAATLAAPLAAYNTFDPAGRRLIDSHLLNAVLVLLLVTSILGPTLTERFAPSLLHESPQPLPIKSHE
jgi:hypothetical protein